MAKSVITTIRLPVDLKKALANAAKAEDRSVNNLVIQILRKWVRNGK